MMMMVMMMLETTRGLKWYPEARVWMFLYSILVVMILEPGLPQILRIVKVIISNM